MHLVRRTLLDRLQGVWLRVNLSYAQHELDWATAAEIEVRWRSHVMTLKDRLKELGHDVEPEDVTGTFEFWLMVGIVTAGVAVTVCYVGYRSALLSLLQ